MSSPFLAEIRIFPFNFAPRSWAFCSGQLMAISQNTALYALVGTSYGGDGRTSFALPNLQGSFPVQQGQGPGLSQYTLGQVGGATTATLTSQQMPMHIHQESAGVASAATATTPGGNLLLQAGLRGGSQLFGSDATTAAMANGALGFTGGNQPHNNMPAYLALNYCIALTGVFPARS